MRYYIAIALLITGCGQAKGSDVNVDVELQPYVDSFQTEITVRGVDITINQLTITFGDDAGKDAAVCFWKGSGVPRVVVNRDLWEETNDIDREMLIYHELGHCILGREHNANMIVNPYNGADRTRGVSLTCLGQKYEYNGTMAESVMHPCSQGASLIYSVLNKSVQFQKDMRRYYVDELIKNRDKNYTGGK